MAHDDIDAEDARLAGEVMRMLAHHSALLTAIGLRRFGRRAADLFEVIDLGAAPAETRHAVRALEDTLEQTRGLSLDHDLAVAIACARAAADFAEELSDGDDAARANELTRLRLLTRDTVAALTSALANWCERRAFALDQAGRTSTLEGHA